MSPCNKYIYVAKRSNNRIRRDKMFGSAYQIAGSSRLEILELSTAITRAYKSPNA